MRALPALSGAGESLIVCCGSGRPAASLTEEAPVEAVGRLFMLAADRYARW